VCVCERERVSVREKVREKILAVACERERKRERKSVRYTDSHRQ
jgi:hypothetical protein